MSDDDHAFYTALAPWWPLISPLEDYRDEAALVLDRLAEAGAQGGTLLELGSGGGHVAHYLADRFELTLVDRAEAMLAASRQLHPHAEHVCADLRRLRLGRTFDVVLVHDAIDYMTSPAELRAALTTAFEHLRPGGVAVVLPDHTTEIFTPGEDIGGSDAGDGRAVRFLEWSTAPDPADGTVRTDYVFVLRHGDGRVEVVHDVHRSGLFDRATWLQLFEEVGFTVTRHREVTGDERVGRDVFVARRPA